MPHYDKYFSLFKFSNYSFSVRDNIDVAECIIKLIPQWRSFGDRITLDGNKVKSSLAMLAKR